MPVGIAILSTGAIITTGAASANVAMPVNSAGQTPKWVRLAATAACYVNLGAAGNTAAAGDILVQPADSIVLRAAGVASIAAIQVTAAGVLQISALEDN